MTLEGELDVTVKDRTPTFELTVENTGDETVTCQFTSGCTADFVIEADGDERWRLSNTRMFTQVLSSTDIPPGRAETFEARGDPLEAGTYTAIGILNATNQDCRAETTVSI